LTPLVCLAAGGKHAADDDEELSLLSICKSVLSPMLHLASLVFARLEGVEALVLRSSRSRRYLICGK
jgi:hypothetical protein